VENDGWHDSLISSVQQIYAHTHHDTVHKQPVVSGIVTQS